MYRSSPFCSIWDTSYIMDMCDVPKAVHSVVSGTRVTSQVSTCDVKMYRSRPFRSISNTSYTSWFWTCVKYAPKQSIPLHFEHHKLHHRFGHVWSISRSSPFRSIWNTTYITGLDMCEVCTEAVHSVASGTRVASQVWTSDMCEVCTKAVHSVAFWTPQVTSQVWTCVKYVPKQSIP